MSQHREDIRADTETAPWPHRPPRPSDDSPVYSSPVQLISADLRSRVGCGVKMNFNGIVMSSRKLYMKAWRLITKQRLLRVRCANPIIWWTSAREKVCYYTPLGNKNVTYTWWGCFSSSPPTLLSMFKHGWNTVFVRHNMKVDLLLQIW